MSNGAENLVDPDKLDIAVTTIKDLKKKLDEALAKLEVVVKAIVGKPGQWTDEVADELLATYSTWKGEEVNGHERLTRFSTSIGSEAAALRKSHKVRK